MTTVKEFTYHSANGKNEIYAKMWIPDEKPHAVLQIAHGLNEHIGRYDAFAAYMASCGYVVVGNDHLGHGHTALNEEDFVFFDEQNGWDLALQDIRTLFEQTHAAYPDLPYFMFGHSMGSFLLRSYIIRWPGELFGAIICGTGQMPRRLLTAGKCLVRWKIARHGPKYRMEKFTKTVETRANRPFRPIRTEKDWLSRDPEAVDANISDPLCGHIITAALFKDMLGGMSYNRKLSNLAQMDPHLRVLFISGEKDPIGDNGRGVRAVYNSFLKAGMKHVRLKLFVDARHELLNETNRGEVYEYIHSWAEKRIANKFKGAKK